MTFPNKLKPIHHTLVLLCLFGCADKTKETAKVIEPTPETSTVQEVSTSQSPSTSAQVSAVSPTTLPAPAVAVDLEPSEAEVVPVSPVESVVQGPTLDITKNSLFSEGPKPLANTTTQDDDVAIEVTTPAPISAINEDSPNASPNLDSFPPNSFLSDSTTPSVRKVSRTIRYDEIDQSRLRRTELAYLLGDDKPYTGLAFKTHPDGTRSFEIDYVEGSAEGVLTQYYPNGNPSFQVPMKNNQANGVSTGWYEDQTRKSEYPYKDGVVHGVIKEWFPTGQLGFEATYLDGKITGTLRGWHLNGDEYILGEIEQDQAQRFVAYYGPGRRWKETGWRFGKLWGYSYEWTPDGKLRSLKRFVNGKLIKVIK